MTIKSHENVIAATSNRSWFQGAMAALKPNAGLLLGPLAAGLLLSLPKIGVLDRKAVKQNHFLIIIFSAGAISMGNVLLETNTLPLLTERLIGWMEPRLSGPISFTVTLYLGAFYRLIFANRLAVDSRQASAAPGASSAIFYSPGAPRL